MATIQELREHQKRSDGKLEPLKDKDTGFKRLDRHTFDEIEPKLKKELQNGEYSDYHALRPPLQYEKINNEIVDLVR